MTVIVVPTPPRPQPFYLRDIAANLFAVGYESGGRQSIAIAETREAARELAISALTPVAARELQTAPVRPSSVPPAPASAPDLIEALKPRVLTQRERRQGTRPERMVAP